MSEWNYHYTDLGDYTKKVVGGGRTYFIKVGKKFVSIYEFFTRKFVKEYVAKFPKPILDERKKLDKKRINTLIKLFSENINKHKNSTFHNKKRVTKNEKEILSTLKKMKKDLT